MTKVLKLDMLIGDGTQSTGNPLSYDMTMAVNFFAFIRSCAAAGLCSVVASNFGTGPSPEGDGENYFDGGNLAGGGGSAVDAECIGENAWIYSEWDHGTHIMGVLIQWSRGDAFGGGGGAPGILNGSGGARGVGWAMGVREDGASPWNGTTNDDGADTKGDPVWTAGATTHVLPMSNSPGYSHASSRENMSELFSQSTLTTRYRCHLAANETTILFLNHSPFSGGATFEAVLGRYIPATGLETVCTVPYFMAVDDGTGGWFSLGSTLDYGTEAGTGGEQGGLISDPSFGARPLTLSLGPSAMYTELYQPNVIVTPQRHDLGSMMLFAGFGNGQDNRAFCGWANSEIVATCYNMVAGQTNNLGDRAAIGSYVKPARLHSFPWDGGPPPGTLKRREGRTTVIP